MSNLLVSICIPTYNGEAFITEALQSAIKQSYPHLEIVVSDDKSTDRTLEIVESFKLKTTIPLHIYPHKPQGIGANWNNCIKKANGHFIKILFQDDVLYPDCISNMVALFNKQPELGLVACKRDFIIEDTITPVIKNWIAKYKNLQSQFEKEEDVTVIDKQLFSRPDFLQSPMNKIGEPPTVLFKKEIVNQVGYFDEKLEQILDYVFYYRILKIKQMAIINKPLVAFRIHNKQTTNINRDKILTDNHLYSKLLHREFLPLLHLDLQQYLIKKHGLKARIKNKLKHVFNKLK